jgi:hypothetical protein
VDRWFCGALGADTGRAGLDSPVLHGQSARARWQVDSSRLVSDLATMGTWSFSASCFDVAVGEFDMDADRLTCTYLYITEIVYIYIYI